MGRVRGREAQLEWIYVYLGLVHVVQQKLTQHCKAIILQLKKINNNNKKTPENDQLQKWKRKKKEGNIFKCQEDWFPLNFLTSSPGIHSKQQKQ